ncbi:hypothetical protein DRW07_04325 [Alteromonas sediminis]|uniref:Lysozyme inhibitor LprI-like N-terminal domain-containing protein n=1 Tax=Alteromonas sediminis TaxID=2259342 RepID=A0A3N5ZBF6_9ALTE|nr:lysozyme inhibitor LprI family protein [Alteromonas sediminis]RPJ68634.1 hypothetical protein DRW07_04325 [Alteromonas sediminis]
MVLSQTVSMFVLVLAVTGCNLPLNSKEAEKAGLSACDLRSFRSIEHAIQSGDGHGHGPNIGSDEWKSTIEFKLGVTPQEKELALHTANWCEFIESRIAQSNANTTRSLPSFDCTKTKRRVEELICKSHQLEELDVKLAYFYKAATAKASDNAQHLKYLQAEQRGWLKGRDECWKASIYSKLANSLLA